jgi:hypothetical protein
VSLTNAVEAANARLIAQYQAVLAENQRLAIELAVAESNLREARE